MGHSSGTSALSVSYKSDKVLLNHEKYRKHVKPGGRLEQVEQAVGFGYLNKNILFRSYTGTKSKFNKLPYCVFILCFPIVFHVAFPIVLFPLFFVPIVFSNGCPSFVPAADLHSRMIPLVSIGMSASLQARTSLRSRQLSSRKLRKRRP